MIIPRKMKASDKKKQTMRSYNRKYNAENPKKEATRKKRWYDNMSEEQREAYKKRARENYYKQKRLKQEAALKEIKETLENE